ncbi:DUF7501 family protein [Natronosalvus halobius]|uniref:DUF7501 family protein n=1 Tax=Natronosalvus halobius TaxID=2953746 RepID=UPI00209EE313|nr:hypothetical protein [Natronosalvus halobius]USZ72359.1 hypothetical protein NGM15_03340 [Natronosalvus halobius]
MSTHATHWNDTATCPFCGGELSDPGAGFVDHLGVNPECQTEFDSWRDNVADDLGGTWSG